MCPIEIILISNLNKKLVTIFISHIEHQTRAPNASDTHIKYLEYLLGSKLGYYCHVQPLLCPTKSIWNRAKYDVSMKKFAISNVKWWPCHVTLGLSWFSNLLRTIWCSPNHGSYGNDNSNATANSIIHSLTFISTLNMFYKTDVCTNRMYSTLTPSHIDLTDYWYVNM